MTKQDQKTRLFQRYNRLVLMVVMLVVFIASIISISRYYHVSNQYQSAQYQQFVTDVELLNQRLLLGVNTIENLANLAQYHLIDDAINIAPLPQLDDDEEGFFLSVSDELDKSLANNLTGKGRVSQLSKSAIDEIKMTQQISPAFASSVNLMSESSWLYYVSSQAFVSIFPWVDKEQWRYTEAALKSPHYIAISQLAPDELYWSSPYMDTAGTGASFSLGKAVFNQEKYIGSLFLDFNLPKFAEHISPTLGDEAAIVVVNQDQEVLIVKTKNEASPSKLISWRDTAPTELRELDLVQLNQRGPYFKYRDWWVESVKLSANGWYAIQYQPYNAFIAPQIIETLSTFLWSVGSLIIVVLVIYILTLTSFIKPTKSFIQHIENTAKGDPGKETPPPGWMYWYQLVENIFGQNRSLMQQLKDHNSELDQRVDEQTKALREKSEQHQRDFAQLVSVVNAIPELIVFTDPKGLVIAVNQAFRQFIHNKDDTFLNTRVSDMLPKAIAQVLEHFVHLTKQGNTSPLSISNVEVAEQHFNIYCGYIFNDDKAILGSVFIIRDVTAQFASEIELLTAKEHAEEANKAKSQFLANMSHEIRTPINAIDGMMSILENTQLSPIQSQYLSTAQSASGSLLLLVDELLDLAKVESGNMRLFYKRCSLDNVIEQAVQFNLAKAKQRGLDFVIELSPHLPSHIKTDEGRLVQVLNNILNNAIKFTPKGSISLYVNTFIKEPNQNRVKIKFAISDTGIGIKEEAQKGLFNAFTQVDESMTREYGGSGLGLAICQQIVSLMGGEISIESNPGQGSEFSFVLSFDDATYHEPVNSKMNIACLATDISANAIMGINHLSVSTQHFAQVNELNQINQNTVLLLDLQQHDIESFFVEMNQQRQQCPENWQYIKALGIISLDQERDIALLEQNLLPFKLPYLFIEQPVFRSSLLSLCGLGVDAIATAKIEQKHDEVEDIDLADKHVLLVEDNLVNQMVAKQLLHSMGINVEIAENGQQALDKVQTQGFDLVLMDIQMPVMDGLTATKKIRSMKKFETLPIIAMTAHAREEDRQNSFQAGMNLHIAKPVTAKILKQGIAKVLA